MRRLDLAALAVAAFSLAAVLNASAADLHSKAPVKTSTLPPLPWMGFYVGGHIGALWSHETRDVRSPLAEVYSQSGQGWLGGGQIGYDYQFAPHALVGIEGAFSGVKLNLENPSIVFPPSRYITTVDWLASVTARLGYVAGPLLVYGRGGYAATKVTFIGTTPGDYVSVGGTRGGWTLGAGIEYLLWRNVSIALEYNHYDFGTKHYDSTTVGGLPLNSDVTFKLDDVKLRANVRFGG